MARKHSLTELMETAGVTMSGLADKSGVSETTIRRALGNRDDERVNTTSATAIAEALDSTVGDINWPGGLSNRGRPARTGRLNR